MFEIDPNGDGSIEPDSKLVSPLDLQKLNIEVMLVIHKLMLNKNTKFD